MTYKFQRIEVPVAVEDLKGKVLKSCKVNDDDTEIVFLTRGGEKYKILHYQDCCESVYIESIVGDLEDLVGNPITFVEESTNRGACNEDGSQTLTFYRFATIKGYVVIRCVVGSNGYSSERVDFVKIEDHVSY